ncbi:hypothetical protein CRE_13750 [Caenorhabditis remanei]|uniref:C2H2-type domain-containing protein n=1 Tax=Caenorhabditis remanei TaxID=31234 RepID=E3NH55_CAERE|nr:hypothetical protein CRE_13750 [Caenorhabditis remanei]
MTNVYLKPVNDNQTNKTGDNSRNTMSNSQCEMTWKPVARTYAQAASTNPADDKTVTVLGCKYNLLKLGNTPQTSKRSPPKPSRGGARISSVYTLTDELEITHREEGKITFAIDLPNKNNILCPLCRECTQTRGRGSSFTKHMKLHVKEKHQLDATFIYKCSMCNEYEPEKKCGTKWIQTHLQKVHNYKYDESAIVVPVPRLLDGCRRTSPTTNQKVSDVLKKAAPSLQRPERAVRKGYTAPPVEETTPEKILRVEAMEKMPQTRAVTKSLSVLKESVKKSVKKTEEKQMGKKVFSIFSKNGETSSPASRRLSVAPVRTNSLGSVVDLSNLQGPERVKAAKLNAQISARMETKRRRSSLSVLKPQKVSGKSGKEETNRISEIIPEDSVVSRENDWNESGVLNLTFESDGSNGYVGKRFNTWCLDHEDSREAWLSDEYLEGIQRAWDYKVEKYTKAYKYLEARGIKVTVLPIVVGSLGTWWKPTTNSLLQLGIDRKTINEWIPKLCAATAEYSKNIYWRHIKGDRYQSIPMKFGLDKPPGNSWKRGKRRKPPKPAKN